MRFRKAFIPICAHGRLQPKIGLLGMVLDPVLNGIVEDAYIVPVSIYYDGAPLMQGQGLPHELPTRPSCSCPVKVMETESYVRELLGSKKRKEAHPAIRIRLVASSNPPANVPQAKMRCFAVPNSVMFGPDDVMATYVRLTWLKEGSFPPRFSGREKGDNKVPSHRPEGLKTPKGGLYFHVSWWNASTNRSASKPTLVSV